MGLKGKFPFSRFKCCSTKCRVRQKPVLVEQLDMFGLKDFFYHERKFLYVQEKGNEPQSGSSSF